MSNDACTRMLNLELAWARTMQLLFNAAAAFAFIEVSGSFWKVKSELAAAGTVASYCEELPDGPKKVGVGISAPIPQSDYFSQWQ